MMVIVYIVVVMALCVCINMCSITELLYNIFCSVAKLVGMEIVHDDGCKTVVMAIISEVCPSASYHVIQTRPAEMSNCSSMQHNKI